MASSSSVHQWQYDVFLSFRGEDTRKNFTDHLYYALIEKAIFTFRDDEQLERGKEISSELFTAIEQSRFAIIVFSKHYATSTWCLDELAKIVDCMEDKGQTAVPIFYDVDPSDVRKQRGDFKEAFDKHEEENQKKVQTWRSALKRVASISGYHLQERHESEFIQGIVRDLSRKLDQAFPSYITRDLVGMESRVEKMMAYIKPGLNDVRFIGIRGMGGIGKTTIAKIVYDMLSKDYDCRCFLANIREVYDKKGLKPLQKTLLRSLLHERNLYVGNIFDGINLIRRRLYRKKVFLVLDDVDQLEQLENLAGEREWFGSGSRIIITSRYKHLLSSHVTENIYDVNELTFDESLRLFHLKAFKTSQATNDLRELAQQVVNYTTGLPLAIVVLGSHFCGRSSVEVWKSALDRLQQYPNRKILESLRISYDGLENVEKNIFLDIACFFKGKKKDRVIEILNSCNFFANIGIQELIDKSLITITSRNELWMHHLLQEMGWEIVREQHYNDPGKWSRLWVYKDICQVLTKIRGTQAIEGIMVDMRGREIMRLHGKSFSAMTNLRLLKISNVHLSENLEFLSSELRFFKWNGYPLKSLPLCFHPENLFELNMCNSSIEYLWEGMKSFLELKTINLSHSCNLITTPDFTGVPNLERLYLEGCTKLRKVHPSVAVLTKLTVFVLKNCTNLLSFPSDIHGLKSLKILNLCGCLKIDKLPQNIEVAKCLEELDISRTAIRQIPSSIVQLKKLEKFSLHGCKGQVPQTWFTFFLSLLLPNRNPDSMCLLLPPLSGLINLKVLDLSDCNLLHGAIPNDIGSLCSLEELNLSGNNFDTLPPSINQLMKLKILCLERCKKLQSLPELPPEIVFLGAEDCTSLERLSLPEQSTSSDIALHFFNCFKLVEYYGSNLAVMMLKLWLQKLSHEASQFHTRLPGSKIPRWFNHRSNTPSIEIGLPPYWFNDELMGFALAVVFDIRDHSDEQVVIECWIRLQKASFLFNFAIPSFTAVESDHLWLCFLSREAFEREYDRALVSNCTYVHANFSVKSGRNTILKSCGIHLLYKEDLEYLDLHHLEELPQRNYDEDYELDQTCDEDSEHERHYDEDSDFEEELSHLPLKVQLLPETLALEEDIVMEYVTDSMVFFPS
ncbi:TMV resistance protein N-like isoform X3 [Pistacia vera]|uniref:TMV resistance protein N-like isoform X3 n=1 Tax=Pistacia vera TaxID=55513 RepID=UPI0012634993|nr:TMV resistance protein N-like isoform X3 [Pistacia vera]XP_031258096.1 TMV resistance protein N-like isoform X3 [Pistacia vera]XP_031258097.1 TMV resistance protein N-like isoform X3 [Pistacia vera]